MYGGQWQDTDHFQEDDYLYNIECDDDDGDDNDDDDDDDDDNGDNLEEEIGEVDEDERLLSLTMRVLLIRVLQLWVLTTMVNMGIERVGIFFFLLLPTPCTTHSDHGSSTIIV